MSSKKEASNLIQNEKKLVQAVVVLDTFSNEFRPLSDDIPIALIPLVNKPLIDYTLEFLHLTGVGEAFLFCCSHVDSVKAYVKKCHEESKPWTVTMKVKIMASETCCSFGDCLRDIDAKGLIRGDFILLEPGVISNVKLLPIIEQHKKHVAQDKGAAMTLIYQETTVRQLNKYSSESMVVAMNDQNKILSHKKTGSANDDLIDFPLEIFLENSVVNIRHNFRDTHIAVCSPSVLPLFADNFDFQTKDDFIRGLLMNEEILESTVYCHILKNDEYGSAVSNWRMYQVLSHEVAKFWMYPLTPSVNANYQARNNVIAGKGTKIPDTCRIYNAIIGDNVDLGENIQLKNCFILPDSKIENNVKVINSIVGNGCLIKANSCLEDGTILGQGVVVEKGSHLNKCLVKSHISDADDEDDFKKHGDKAFIIVQEDNSDVDSNDCDIHETETTLLTQSEKFDIDEERKLYEADDISDSDDEKLSYINSPAPDDTKLFFTEVVDSLTRGFEDKLLCENLILEVNSSRYAYNVTLREVNFNVVRAILHMSMKNHSSKPIVSYLNSLLTYFHPLLSNYLRSEDAMEDCLQAVEDVATTYENVTDKWVVLALRWLYDKEHITEDAILKWHNGLDASNKLYNYVKPFVEWLQEAEETSSEEESSED